MLRIAATAAAAVAISALLGCASLDLMGHRRDLEESQRKYTQFIRWGEYVAAADFVEPDLRTDFLKEVEAYENIRMSDYEIRFIEPNDELTKAEVRVSYDAYNLRNLTEKKVFETQNWLRTDSGWMVRPDLEGLRANAKLLQP